MSGVCIKAVAEVEECGYRQTRGREIDKSTKVIADGSNAQDQGACHVLERVCVMSSRTLFALTTFDDLQCLLPSSQNARCSGPISASSMQAT